LRRIGIMSKKSMLGVALVVGLGVSLAPLHAQRGPGPWGEPGPHMGRSLDVALEHQDELGLTRDQAAGMSELRAALERDVLPLTEEIKLLREAIWAGEMDRPEGFRQMEALRGELITASAPFRGRVQEILTVEQHRKLQTMMGQLRPWVGDESVAPMGRLRGGMMAPMARPGAGAGVQLRGGWGGRGANPGFRGPARFHQRWWRDGGDPLGS
jgi:Spy/CpxP family protein refolding chaperone